MSTTYSPQKENQAYDSELNELLDACEANNRNAQRKLYETYFGKFMGHCMRYFDSRDLALEALNHGFLKIFKSLNTFDRTKSFGAWAYRIVQRTALDYIRKNAKYTWEPLENNIKTVETKPEIDHEHEMEFVLEKLNILPLSSRAVFILYVLDGFKHKEIAKELKISEGTSRWHLNNAKEILKKNWKEEHYG